ncbi:hypothetical protein RYX36_018731 [Vicia faba]
MFPPPPNLFHHPSQIYIYKGLSISIMRADRPILQRLAAETKALYFSVGVCDASQYNIFLENLYKMINIETYITWIINLSG